MPLSRPPVNVTLAGNTAGAMTLVRSGTMTLAGGNNITLSQAGNAVTIVGGAGGGGGGSNSGGISTLGNTSGTTGMASGSAIQLLFVGGNNVTLSQSLDAGAASATITISAANETKTVPAIATAVSQVASANSVGTKTRFAAEDHAHAGVNLVQISGNTSNSSSPVQGSVYFAGGNNITLSQVTGAGAATITISAANETQTVPPIATTGLQVQSANSVGTVTRFAAEDHAHAGLNLLQISGNTSNTSNAVQGSVYLAGGNNITLSQATGAGKATITISGPDVSNFLTTARRSTDAIGLNTAQTNVTWTANSGGLSLNAAGYAGTATTLAGTNISLSATLDSGGLNLAASVAAAGAANLSASNAIQSVSSATGSGTNTSRFAADDHVHAGVGPAGVSNLGNTVGSTAVLHGQLVLVGGNNITLSQSTDASNRMTVTVSGREGTLSSYENIPMFVGTTTAAYTGSSVYVCPFLVPNYVSLSYIRLPATFSLVSSFFNSSNASNTTTSAGNSGTINLVIYTQGVGNSSLSIQQWQSTSAGWTYSVTASGGPVSAPGNYTLGQSLTYPGMGGGAALNTNVATSTSGGSYTIYTSHLSQFTGVRYLDIPLETMITPGNYWIGLNQSTATGGTGIGWSHSNYFETQINIAIGALGSVTNSSLQFQVGVGSWSTDTNGTWTASIALANVSSRASQYRLPMQFLRFA